MARRRSYGKGKDPVLVFMNNCVAEGQNDGEQKKKTQRQQVVVVHESGNVREQERQERQNVLKFV